MPSDKKGITVRFQDEKYKKKFQRIARKGGRSTSREAEQILTRYVDAYELKHGEVKIE